MKIRIFALAKELGLDSKVLIEYASGAGITLKNSALASISPEQRDVLVSHIQQAQAGSSSQPKPQESLAPTRDPARDVGGKVRAIKTVGPRLQNAQESVAESPESTAAATAEMAASDVAVEAPADEVESEVAQEPDDAEELQEAVAEVDDTSSDGDAAADVVDQEDAVTEDDESDESSESVRPDDPSMIPLARTGAVPEMVPRGTVSTSESSRTRESTKRKPKVTMPTVAAPPKYVPPKPKVSKQKEVVAQKPDIPLTAEIFEQQSPLKAHLQEKKKKKKQGVDAGGAPVTKDVMARAGKPAAPGATERRPNRKFRQGRRGGRDDGGDYGRRSYGRRRKSTAPVALKTSAQIELPITIRGLSEAMGRPAKDLLRILMQRGEMITINENVTEEIALELALEMGVDLEVKRPRDIEDELSDRFEVDGPEENLVKRPPIITILGHVDHGKTTLLDKIRSENVAGGEAGGITQHIAAYQVEHNGEKLTFVDTPGHAAFGEMRARGADVTDIVVLVVAVDDGVMPQTVECISHAKAAGVPMVVAMNKCDLPDKNEQRVLQDLAANDVLPAEWGGDVEVVRTSGESGEGLDELLETLTVTSELQELTASPNRSAVGVCLEAFRDEGRGVLAWFMVQKGTLQVGDVVLCGNAHGRVRAIYNDHDEEVEQAGPSTPVKVAGLNVIPAAGAHFYEMSDIEEAREAADSRHDRGRARELSGRSGGPRTMEDILEQARGGVVQDLPLILKADTPGSIEALRGELGKLEHPEVQLQIVHEGVGGVNESDIYLASASGAIIIAFHVVPEDRAQQLAEREGVEIRRYNVIYEVTATIKDSLEGLLLPERVEVSTGRALVLQTFHISRFGTIAGCRILNGTIERSHRLHVIRDQTILNNYEIASLKREKDDVKEVREGMECGIRLEGFNDIHQGDLFEAFRVDEVKRTLD